MSECQYCESPKRKRMKTTNKAHQLKIGKTWDGNKHKQIRLMIGEWNGYMRCHQLKSSLIVNYCPMCGRNLHENKEV